MPLNEKEKILIETRNCTIESYLIPDLRLKEGQLLRIRSPLPLIEKYFCSQDRVEGLYLYFQPFWVTAALHLNPWHIALLKKETVFDYMKRLSDLNNEQIAKFLRDIQVDSAIPSKYIAGASNKMLINAKIALSRFKFVMFNTAGMDLSGIEKIHELVISEVKELQNRSVITIENSSNQRHFSFFEIDLFDLK